MMFDFVQRALDNMTNAEQDDFLEGLHTWGLINGIYINYQREEEN